jgi:rhamnulokinase
MSQPAHLAIDFGAESGRVIVGTLADGRLSLHEAHRFRHLPVPTPAGLCWDLTGLWQQVLEGLRRAAGYLDEQGLEPVSVGVDTWGVDFSLISPNGVLLGLPRAYRDPDFNAAFDRVVDQVPAASIYAQTGIQLMPLNSLYQYASRHAQEPGIFAEASDLMFMPDLFHWLLSGKVSVERTIASTSQMVDVRRGDWNRDLLAQLNLPTGPLKPPVDPGTVLGTLTADVASATGLPPSVQIVLPPSHDTASAVAAVPAAPDTSWCFLSSGTWSLLGAELDEPCINEATAAANFTNELGMAGKTRFLKNIAGLWLVQEVRRDLERQGQPLDYAELTQQAAGAEPFRTLLPVNDPAFAQPGGAIDRIRAYAKQSGQPVPETVGQLVRAGLESLALEYRQTIDTLEELLDRRFDVLHLVGGGGKNGLLNRMAADATGKTIVVGPDEATAMGNLLTQAQGLGVLDDLPAMRRVVRDSVELETLSPDDGDGWSESFDRYVKLSALKTD